MCATALNNLLLRKDLSYWAKGMQIRFNLSHIEQWIRDKILYVNSLFFCQLFVLIIIIICMINLLYSHKILLTHYYQLFKHHSFCKQEKLKMMSTVYVKCAIK